METNRKVVELNIKDVLPNRFQPRIKFNEDAITELSKSIKEHGVIQPIVVRPIGDKYEIIAGERRYKATVMSGKTSIPAIITDLNDKDSAEVALIENVQRQNLTPIEEAISYKKILDMGYLKQEELAVKLGKNQSTIANKLRLLNLTDEVQEALLEEKISERHARSILKLTKPQEQVEILNRIIDERMPVRKADEEINRMLNGNNIEFENSSTLDNQEDMITDNNVNMDGMIEEINFDEPIDFVSPEEIDASIEATTNNPVIEQPSQPILNMNSEIDSININNVSDMEVEEEIKPHKFFNILDSETPNNVNNNVESSAPQDTFDFTKAFINPPIVGVNNTEKKEFVGNVNPNEDMLEELNEIEKSINTANTINPVQDENIVDSAKYVEKESFPAIQEEKMVDLDFAIPNNNMPEERNTKQNKPDLKTIINMIRKCSDEIEDSGYVIDTEEIDLEGIYQVIFKITKI